MSLPISRSEIKRLVVRYRTAVNDVLGEFVSAVASDPRQLRRQINRAMQELDDLDLAARAWAARNITGLYRKQNAEAQRQVREALYGPSQEKDDDRKGIIFFGVEQVRAMNDGTIHSLLHDPDAGFLSVLFAATGQIRRGLRTIERAARGLRGREELLQAVKRGFGGLNGDSAGQLKNRLERAIGQAAESERARRVLQHGLDAAAKLPFVKLPNGRLMRLDRYAELAARTKAVQAEAMANRNAVLQQGGSFVRISENPSIYGDACDLFTGHVFALTREAAEISGLPHVSELPSGGAPMHPNCTHSELPYFLTLEQSAEQSLPRPPEWALRKSWHEVETLYRMRGRAGATRKAAVR